MVDPEIPFNETNCPEFVQFCRRHFPSEIIEAVAVVPTTTSSEKEESTTGPPRRARLELADDAAMDESVEQTSSSDDDSDRFVPLEGALGDVRGE